MAIWHSSAEVCCRYALAWRARRSPAAWPKRGPPLQYAAKKPCAAEVVMLPREPSGRRDLPAGAERHRVGAVIDHLPRLNLELVHGPDRELAGGPAPQDVGLAIAVVVANAGDAPGHAGIDRVAIQHGLRVGDQLAAIQFPDADLAGRAAPQDVRLTIAVEVA